MAYNSKEFDIFIGVDVDQRSYAFTVKDQNNMSTSHKIPAIPENLYHYILKMYNGKKVICAYEAGGSGYHLHDYMSDRQVACLIAPPPSIPKASNDKVKNNRIDSDKIAKHLKNGDLPHIRVPHEAYRSLRLLTRSREDYVDSGRIAKQRIKALLLFAHLYRSIKEPSSNWSNRYIMELKNLACQPVTRQRLNFLLEDLKYSRNQNLKILKELRSFCTQQPDIQRNIYYLRSIPGIGFITAVTVLANIGDPIHLKNVREIAGFSGLVPTEHSTGEKVSKGGITHLGNPVLRSLLIEAAWVVIRHDTRLRQFYNRIRTKNHPGIGARKAIVAVARKLTMIIYKVLKEQREYISY